MNYEQFKTLNLAWDNSYCIADTDYFEKKMRKNWEIVRNVKREFYKHYNRGMPSPQKGDVIEFAHYNKLYDKATVESVNKFGVMSICEQASTFTDGKCFSTSGGAWTHSHKSHFEFAGYAYRRFWTWGVSGSGAHQGVYFDILVKKFRQIDMPKLTPEHRIYFHNPYYKDRGSAVVVMQDWNYIHKEFKTLHAFRDWADYIGLTFHKDDNAQYWTDQFLKQTFFCVMDEIPEGSKPIAAYSNGRKVKCFYHKDGDIITLYRPNPNAKEVYIPFEDEFN